MQDTFAIFQVKEGDETWGIRFEPLERLKATGRSVERENYMHVYTGPLEPSDKSDMKILSELWERFNIDHPEDYRGRSMSVSDIAVFYRDGKETAYYCDSYGFTELPEFTTGPFKYYSTQRPVDIGTFPKFAGEPVSIENFDSRQYVEDDTILTWGVLTYSVPLSQKQMDDYELKPAPDNPDMIPAPGKMKVLLVKPNEYAIEAKIDKTLKAAQKVVGGNIETFRPGNDPVVCVINEEGKILELEGNRAICDNRGNVIDIIAGTFFVCGVEDGDFVSLSPELMEKYKKQFFEPQMFVDFNGRIRVIKLTDERKSIVKQLEECGALAAQDNATRTAPPKKKEQDISD